MIHHGIKILLVELFLWIFTGMALAGTFCNLSFSTNACFGAAQLTQCLPPPAPHADSTPLPINSMALITSTHWNFIVILNHQTALKLAGIQRPKFESPEDTQRWIQYYYTYWSLLKNQSVQLEYPSIVVDTQNCQHAQLFFIKNHQSITAWAIKLGLGVLKPSSGLSPKQTLKLLKLEQTAQKLKKGCWKYSLESTSTPK
jgi:endonuclease YncB( thermonuclease family)